MDLKGSYWSWSSPQDNEWGYSNRLVDLAVHMSQATQLGCVCWMFGNGSKRKSHDDMVSRWNGSTFWALRPDCRSFVCSHAALHVPICQVDGVIPPPAKIQSIKALRKIHDSWHLCVNIIFEDVIFVRTICKCIEWIYSWQFMTIQVYCIYFYLHMNPLHWIYVTKLWFHLISFARTRSFGFSFRGFALLLMVQCTLEVKMLFCFLVWSDTAE